MIVGTVATTAILTEPPDVDLHLKMLDALARLADYDDDARATLATIRDTYRTC